MSVQTSEPPVSVLVTDRAGAPDDGAILNTPGAYTPNVVVRIMTPIAQVIVRGLRTYLQSLVGFLLLALASRPMAEALGVVIPPGDFLEAFKVSAGLAVAPCVVSVLQNGIELLARLDEMFPKVRA